MSIAHRSGRGKHIKTKVCQIGSIIGNHARSETDVSFHGCLHLWDLWEAPVHWSILPGVMWCSNEHLQNKHSSQSQGNTWSCVAKKMWKKPKLVYNFLKRQRAKYFHLEGNIHCWTSHMPSFNHISYQGKRWLDRILDCINALLQTKTIPEKPMFVPIWWLLAAALACWKRPNGWLSIYTSTFTLHQRSLTHESFRKVDLRYANRFIFPSDSFVCDK